MWKWGKAKRKKGKVFLQTVTTFPHSFETSNYRFWGHCCTFVPPPPRPPIVIDDSSWKNVAESFTVALTLTLGGYKSAIAPVQGVYIIYKSAATKSLSCRADFDHKGSGVWGGLSQSIRRRYLKKDKVLRNDICCCKSNKKQYKPTGAWLYLVWSIPLRH